MNWFDADLMPLTEALGLLPGVQPQKARTFLYSLRDELADRSLILWKKDERAVATIEPLPGLVLTLGFTDDLFYGEEFGKQRITPRGAKLLMTLYEGGALPCRAVRGQIDAKLIAYSGSEDSLIAQVRAKREEARIATERRQGFIRDPSKLPEAEFTYAILNDIFFAHRGPTRGMATMKIGGIEVIKEVSGYASNSGKSRDSDVRITWVGSDGITRSLSNAGSRYATNRRNDAERNWGLGRD